MNEINPNLQPQTQMLQLDQNTRNQKDSNIESFLQATTIELLIVFVGFNIIMLVLNYFNIVPVSQKFPNYFSWLPHEAVIVKDETNALPPLTPIPTPENPNLVELPIDPGKDQISSIFINYILTGYIGEINRTENKVSLIFKDKSIPEIVIGQTTEILKEEANNRTPTQVADLKLNDLIRVDASYNLKNGEWISNRVVLLKSE